MVISRLPARRSARDRKLRTAAFRLSFRFTHVWWIRMNDQLCKTAALLVIDVQQVIDHPAFRT
jgi:hypothetical protein